MYAKTLSRMIAKYELEKMGSFPEFLGTVGSIINKHGSDMERIKALFEELGYPNLLLPCPDCGCEVLLEFGNCPICDSVLIENSETKVVIEAKPVAKVQVEEPAPVEVEEVKVEAKPTPVVETLEVKAEEAVVEEPELTLVLDEEEYKDIPEIGRASCRERV